MATRSTNSNNYQGGEPVSKVSLENILEDLAGLLDPTLSGSTDETAQVVFSKTLREILVKIGTLVSCKVGSVFVISPRDGKLCGLVNFGYEKDISDIEYELGKEGDGSDLFRDKSDPESRGGGITAYVATTGKPEWLYSQKDVQKHEAWAGKVDDRQWVDLKFKNCGILPLEVGSEIIGVVKFENFEPEPDASKKSTILAIKPFIALALDTYRRQLTPGEKQYLLTKEECATFKPAEIGNVQLEHLLTSICASDMSYFEHRKPKEKLAERLPMVLGHEVVAIVRERGLGQRYELRPSLEPTVKPDHAQQIKIGDHVVVIPQIPCTVCDTCDKSDGTIKTYGENYCANVKHMASNVDGSLRTKFRYQRELLIPYNPRDVADEIAVLTEPFAQLVQVCRELGFSNRRDEANHTPQGFKLNLSQFKTLTLDNAFMVHPDDFDSYFRIFASSHQLPRTLLRLPAFDNRNNRDKDDEDEHLERKFSHYALMRRGLFVSASRSTELEKKKPRVLILGSGPTAFIAALLMREAYCLDKDQVYIYGRRAEPLSHFSKCDLGMTIDVSTGTIENTCVFGRREMSVNNRTLFEHGDTTRTSQKAITQYLQSNGVQFDIIMECIGGDATEQLIDFAAQNAAQGALIALFGLSEKPIKVNFRRVLDKELTFKGFYRACRESYFEALDFLRNKDFAEKAKELVSDFDRDQVKYRVESISDAQDLANAFHKSKSPDFWGKVVVQLADTVLPIVSPGFNSNQSQ